MADGMGLECRQSTLVIFEQQSLLSELPEQFFDLSVLELKELLLTLVREGAESGQQAVQWLEDAGNIRRPKPVRVR